MDVITVRGAISRDRQEARSMQSMQMSSFDPMTMRQAHVGSSLRAVYDGVADSPLPDQFDALLAELDKINPPASGR